MEVPELNTIKLAQKDSPWSRKTHTLSANCLFRLSGRGNHLIPSFLTSNSCFCKKVSCSILPALNIAEHNLIIDA